MTGHLGFSEEDVQRAVASFWARTVTVAGIEPWPDELRRKAELGVRAILAALVEDGWRKRPVLSGEDWASLRDEGPVLAQRAAEIAVRLCPRCGGQPVVEDGRHEWALWTSESPGVPAGIGHNRYEDAEDADEAAADLRRLGWDEVIPQRRWVVVGPWEPVVTRPEGADQHG